MPKANLTANSPFRLPEHQLDCPECGLSLTLPALYPGEEAYCLRCRHSLVRVEANPLQGTLSWALASVIMILLVYSQPYLSVDLPGVHTDLSLWQILGDLLGQDFGFLAEVMFILTFGTPIVFCLLCLYVYTALSIHKILPHLLYAARVLVWLRDWMMVDVFFISTLVAYIKLNSVAHVTFGAAFWLILVLAILLIRTAQSVPSHWIYYQIQRVTAKKTFLLTETPQTVCCSKCLYFQPANLTHCQVCGNALYQRRPMSLRTSAVFLLTAALLYLPANLLPIMISSNPMSTEINTIFNGIQFMWRDGDKLIALIIFSASMAIPVLKMISMSVLLYSAACRPLLPIKILSPLYRITESVGRWSMIDVFVIIILMASFHTPIARVTPGPAVVYFCLVVVLTMLSAYYFDPRLIWDKINRINPLPPRL
ncbi:paraquat-inducible protein A [Stenoxybacter acetivorans]|uniref:paraquat-inducible protein A n=1 Tax=Stenoxybacter acetivorans TaxID=422441 RepID=UPI0009FFEBBC|nr:paraquat-inducible protein A [Stenoxybacter acetivorans]